MILNKIDSAADDLNTSFSSIETNDTDELDKENKLRIYRNNVRLSSLFLRST